MLHKRLWLSTCRQHQRCLMPHQRLSMSWEGLYDRRYVEEQISVRGQDFSVDLNDCVNDVQINSLLYCSDQDEIHAIVWKSFVRVDVPLVRSSCSSVGAKTYTGSGDHPSVILFCYTGSKLDERVNLKVNSFNSDAGSFDLTGSGLESIACLEKSFSGMVKILWQT